MREMTAVENLLKILFVFYEKHVKQRGHSLSLLRDSQSILQKGFSEANLNFLTLFLMIHGEGSV